MVCHKVVIGSFVRLRVLQARDTGAFVAESSSRAEPPAAAEGRSRGTRPLVLPLPGATSSARPCSYGGRRTVDGAGRGARAARSCRWRQARETGRPLWRRPGGGWPAPRAPGAGRGGPPPSRQRARGRSGRDGTCCPPRPSGVRCLGTESGTPLSLTCCTNEPTDDCVS